MKNYSLKTVTLTAPWMLEGDYTGNNLTGLSRTTRLATVWEAYARVPLFFRGLRIRCNALLNLPRHLYRTGDKDKTDVDWMFPVPLDWLLWRTQAALLLAGGAPIVKLSNPARRTMGGPPLDLEWLNPFTVTVRWDPTLGKRVYTQAGQMLVGGQVRTWTDDEMIFVRDFNPIDDVGYGVSAASVAFENSRVAFSIPRMAAQFFENGAMPVSILSVLEGTDADEVKRIEGFFQRVMSGIRNAYRTIAVRGDVKLTTTQNRIKDMAASELWDASRKEVARALDMPVTLLDSDETMATATVHLQSLYREGVIPAAKLIADGFNRDCLNPLGYRLEFAPQELDIFQEDEAARAQSFKTYVDAKMDPRVAAAVLGIDVPADVKQIYDKQLFFSNWQTVIEAAKQNIVYRDQALELMGLPKIDNAVVFVGATVRVNEDTASNPITGTEPMDHELAAPASAADPNAPDLPSTQETADAQDEQGGTGDPDERSLQESSKPGAMQKALDAAKQREAVQYRRYLRRHTNLKDAHPFAFQYLDASEAAAIRVDFKIPEAQPSDTGAPFLKDAPPEKEKEKEGGDLVAVLAALAAKYQKDHDRGAFVQGVLGALRTAYEETGATDDEVDEAVDEQSEYVDGLADDLAGGQVSDAQLDARLQLYGGSVYALQQQVQVSQAADDEDPDMTWHIDPNAENCEDCLALDGVTKKASEWEAEGLTPGSGQTQCLGNCRCRLEKD